MPHALQRFLGAELSRIKGAYKYGTQRRDAQHLHSSCRRDMFLLVQAFRRRDSYVGYSIPRIASC